MKIQGHLPAAEADVSSHYSYKNRNEVFTVGEFKRLSMHF